MGCSRNQALGGAMLVVAYTGLIASADGITKLLAGQYAAAQLYALSGAMVVGFCLLADRLPRLRGGFRTRCPRAMALRSVATLIAAVCFFYAFRLLPFAEVFVFIGLMPLLAGAMSGLVLKEPVRPAAWIALLAGFAGVLFLLPHGGDGSHSATGHFVAFAAVVSGTFSMTIARFIGRYESNALAQVFYPNLTLCGAMLLALPFVWVPMPLADVAWAAAYAFLLFGARWLLVVALRLLASYAVTPLMNLQFIWMAVIGAVFFGEFPPASTYLGGAIVIASGLYLVWDQFAPAMPRLRSAGRLQTDP
ncbi:MULTISPECIES: DMT family transporter [unclassified Leisingera]|uniref:DMT family transporter n=1 Tax=unclassified Leisingera TaxID=2614906 RepID=UPI0002EAB1B7|nr:MULTISPECIES: EamA family transporter [unclassified Leisingera]KIC19136.1 membrane protein [Leisingera sp. ANG-DT]KIC26483.1 membrane protein [Leisingera sp. ANG-S3]KIC52802.1 membrane protein [Leisingera sp. ANG-S]KID10199.1 membrane protein [Leisingera sp. ANG1]